jgi:hypothetical protein
LATTYFPGAGACVRRRPVLSVVFAGRLLPKDDADDDRRRRGVVVVEESALGPDTTTSEGWRAFDDSPASSFSAMAETMEIHLLCDPKTFTFGATKASANEANAKQLKMAKG